MYLSKRIQSERILESISQLLHSKYVHAQVVLTCRLNFSAFSDKKGKGNENQLYVSWINCM